MNRPRPGPMIPLSYTAVDGQGLQEILKRYDGRIHMEMVTDFEEQLRKYTGSRFAVALNSGTAAIHLALKAAGVGPGDEVLVSTFTYVATVNPILYLGARPVFIDSELQTWNMDPGVLRDAIRARSRKGIKPKAILVVHAYGMPAQINDILKIGKESGIPVIEDAAESLGSVYHGRATGTLGLAGIYSFNNNKIVTCYGGGAMVTDDEGVFNSVVHWASQSRENKPYYEHQTIGYNYRMGPLSAAYGQLGMLGIEEKVAARRRIFASYCTSFENFTEITWVKEHENCISNRWLSAFLLQNEPGTEIMQAFVDSGIEARPLWKGMHQQPVFQGFEVFGGTMAEGLFRRGICLPSSDDLGTGEQQKVVEIFAQACGLRD